MFCDIMKHWKSACIFHTSLLRQAPQSYLTFIFYANILQLPSLKIVRDFAKFVSFVERNILFSF